MNELSVPLLIGAGRAVLPVLKRGAGGGADAKGVGAGDGGDGG